jgi:xanthosine utilization system XapX-like protein
VWPAAAAAAAPPPAAAPAAAAAAAGGYCTVYLAVRVPQPPTLHCPEVNGIFIGYYKLILVKRFLHIEFDYF